MSSILDKKAGMPSGLIFICAANAASTSPRRNLWAIESLSLENLSDDVTGRRTLLLRAKWATNTSSNALPLIAHSFSRVSWMMGIAERSVTAMDSYRDFRSQLYWNQFLIVEPLNPLPTNAPSTALLYQSLLGWPDPQCGVKATQPFIE